MTFKYVSRTSRMPVTKSCPSYMCVVVYYIGKVICSSCGHVLHKHKPEDAKRWTLKGSCAANKVTVETKPSLP